jgi:hypothetical protein
LLVLSRLRPLSSTGRAINELQSITGSASDHKLGEICVRISQLDRKVKRAWFGNPAVGAIQAFGILALRPHLHGETDVACALALSDPALQKQTERPSLGMGCG